MDFDKKRTERIAERIEPISRIGSSLKIEERSTEKKMELSTPLSVNTTPLSIEMPKEARQKRIKGVWLIHSHSGLSGTIQTQPFDIYISG